MLKAWTAVLPVPAAPARAPLTSRQRCRRLLPQRCNAVGAPGSNFASCACPAAANRLQCCRHGCGARRGQAHSCVSREWHYLTNEKGNDVTPNPLISPPMSDGSLASSGSWWGELESEEDEKLDSLMDAALAHVPEVTQQDVAKLVIAVVMTSFLAFKGRDHAH